MVCLEASFLFYLVPIVALLLLQLIASWQHASTIGKYYLVQFDGAVSLANVTTLYLLSSIGTMILFVLLMLANYDVVFQKGSFFTPIFHTLAVAFVPMLFLATALISCLVLYASAKVGRVHVFRARAVGVWTRGQSVLGYSTTLDDDIVPVNCAYLVKLYLSMSLPLGCGIGAIVLVAMNNC
jgi:hypothetical protein